MIIIELILMSSFTLIPLLEFFTGACRFRRHTRRHNEALYPRLGRTSFPTTRGPALGFLTTTLNRGSHQIRGTCPDSHPSDRKHTETQ